MPLLYTCRAPLMGVWKMDEPWREMLAALPDGGERAAVCSLSSDKRRQERLAVRLLLKHLLNVETCDGSDGVQIAYEANGAPYLTGSSRHISISHTKGFAAVILGDRYPGIDVEYPSDRAWKLRERFLNEDELLLLARLCSDLPAAWRTTLATLCWCAKETAFKALRQEEVDFASHLRILPFFAPPAPFTLPAEGVLTLKETKTSCQHVFTIHYQVTDGYLLTWKG